MSTILKALKRLEEEQPKPSRNAANASGAAASSGDAAAGRVGSEAAGGGSPSSASDPLRERLLAEEALADATAAAAAEERRGMTPLLAGRGPLLAAGAAALVLVCGVIGYSISGDRPDSATDRPSTAVASAPDTATVAPRVSASAPTTDTAGAAPAARSPSATRAAARQDPSMAEGGIASSPAASPDSGLAPVVPTAPTPGSSRSTGAVAAAAIPKVATLSANGGSSEAVSRSSPSPASPPRSAARPMQATPSVAGASVPASEAIVRPTRSAAATDPLPANAARRPIDPSEEVTTHASREQSRTVASASAQDSSSRAASRPRANPPPPPGVRPPSVAAARPVRRATPSTAQRVPEPGQTRVAEGRSSERPTAQPSRTARSAQTSAAFAESVERIDRTSLPDVSVVRTAWHPTPDRRSARIRLEDSGEIRLLKEGDAIGRLVLKEITPSAVLFSAGDVEIRRRVGEGSGGSR